LAVQRGAARGGDNPVLERQSSDFQQTEKVHVVDVSDSLPSRNWVRRGIAEMLAPQGRLYEHRAAVDW
jgi:hypothetical protein